MKSVIFEFLSQFLSLCLKLRHFSLLRGLSLAFNFEVKVSKTEFLIPSVNSTAPAPQQLVSEWPSKALSLIIKVQTESTATTTAPYSRHTN
jgi:hypothetical protein